MDTIVVREKIRSDYALRSYSGNTTSAQLSSMGRRMLILR